jgi:hydrogenase maturation protein HypF
LITRLPYDRPHTTMASFPLCPACRREYEDPRDRRFHAEPVACPVCGPRLRFVDSALEPIADTNAALTACLAALRSGEIVAVKGVGGYHLMCDARNDQAVARLRAHKPRPHKPLAVMFPWQPTLDAVRAQLLIDDAQAAFLRDPMRPILLLRKRPDCALAASIAPGLGEVGAMLPYSPLHHLLLDDFGGPLVATSGNLGGEPVLTDESEAQQRLARITRVFLHHDRPIARPADDSVWRHIAGAARPLRLGRGGAPVERALPFSLSQPLLAVGGHMKNTITLAWDDRCVVSPHIGDMGTARSLQVFEQVIADLQALYGVQAVRLVCDAHPDYATTRWAQQRGLPLEKVFHHHAHASAVGGEYPDDGPWLVFTWDGVGYGEDGSLWGGEALLGRPGAWRRVGTMRPFYLFGGERAGREPWRSAAALAWEAGLEWSEAPADTALAHAAWQRRLNAPQTSAVGRLFDAAAAFTGLCTHASFEGQGPMYLEAVCASAEPALDLPLAKNAHGLWQTDWAPLLPYLMDTRRPVGQRAGGFHASLAQALLAQAQAIRAEHEVAHVGLTGGVFQNRVLTELAMAALDAAGFVVRLPCALPVNDGGLSFGQIIEAGSKS